MDARRAQRRRSVGVASMLLVIGSMTGCGRPDPNVATQHNDNFRTGAYLAETILKPDAVRTRGMRVKYWIPPCDNNVRDPHPLERVAGNCIEGAIVTQPLFVRSVDFTIDTLLRPLRVTLPVVFVATTSNRVYAFNANNGQQLWMVDLLFGSGGHSKWIASTPVINVATNRMYVVYGKKNQPEDLPFCEQRNSPDPRTRDAARRLADRLQAEYWLAMIDITTGIVLDQELVGASVKRRDGRTLALVAKHQVNHPALLLDRGSVYVAFGSPAWSEGCVEYHGWIVRYDENLNRQGVFNTSPDWAQTGRGSGIWQGGGGLAADGSGSVFFLTGDGRADTSLEFVSIDRYNFARPRRFYGNSFMKVRPAGGSFQAWSFAPPDAAQLEEKDADLGSGGALIVPNSNVVIGGGKSGYMYVLDRTSMTLLQQFTGTTNLYNPSLRGNTWDKGPHLHGSPTYWSGPESSYGFLYVWGEKDVLRQFRFNKTTQRIEEPPAKQGTVRAMSDIMPGGMLSLSADGTRRGTGIVWATLPMSDFPKPYPGGLYAYNAESLQFLWQARYGTIAHWVPPTVADGKVFVAEGNPFKPGSTKLTVWELGNGGGDATPGAPSQPQTPKMCQSCHSANLEAIARNRAMSDHHATGGAVRMTPGLILASLAPPDRLSPDVVLEGTGVRTYDARPDPYAGNQLAWVAGDMTADLEEVTRTERSARSAQRARVRLTEGSTWSAPDGSTVVATVERTSPAPMSIDSDWVLFKATTNGGEGVLGRVTYILQAHTHAGRPPKDAPRRVGEVVRVPYTAEYWLYR